MALAIKAVKIIEVKNMIKRHINTKKAPNYDFINEINHQETSREDIGSNNS